MTFNKKTKTILTYFLVWFGFTSIGFVVGFIALYTPKIARLASSGVPIYGRTTSKEPNNHQTVRYSFTVNGNEYSGVGRALNGNPSFNEIQIGQQLLIFYNPNDPKESYLGYPQTAVEENWRGIAFLTLFFSIFPTVQIIRRLNRSNNQ